MNRRFRRPRTFWTSPVIAVALALSAATDAQETAPQKARANEVHLPRPMAINVAEAVIEPFWDPYLSGLPKWAIDPGDEHGLEVWQDWAAVRFEWASRPSDGPALRMRRAFQIDCSGYDKLLLSVQAPERSEVRILADTDKGTLSFVSSPAGYHKEELAVDLEGATLIQAITIEIYPADDGFSSGWFSWLGLQNAALIDTHLARWRGFDDRWEAYIQDESFEPEFKPLYGVFISENGLDDLRRRHDEHVKAHGGSPFAGRPDALRDPAPEKVIGEFARIWDDRRFNRVREHDLPLLNGGESAAISGIILKDKALLRLAARYALSIAMCEHWDEGFVSRFPGGVWEHRAFVRSQCAYTVAMALDLAGEMFTETGRTFLARRLAEEGVGKINYVTWRHEYVFHCNQLAWFTPGRMANCLVLEKIWPRAKPQTDIAYGDLLENIDNILLPDGGFVEGPGYLTTVVRAVGVSLHYYANAREKEFFSLLPDKIKRTGDFAAAVASTVPDREVISIGDADTWMHEESLMLMAAVLPDSAWAAMCRKILDERGGVPRTFLGWQLAPHIPETASEFPPFVHLLETGLMASMRKLDGHPVKILALGNRANAGHSHEDKGSFVLEFAGETFAPDPGTGDYASQVSLENKTCQRHNMLVPLGTPERPHPANPLPVDVIPEGRGDDTAFQAVIDATPGWEGYYAEWVRTWDSPSPDVLRIRDDYALAAGDAVEFYWQTRLPVRIQNAEVIIEGRKGTIRIAVPEDCSVRIDDLPAADGTQHRIAFRKEAPEGTLEIVATLAAHGL
ncbi:MAG TPA: hypothetical protein HPP77_08155 [Candidatus Hydrogenedentes bacterium]|nr:hypothetical protein [Candidatus Hydrogenedentota bacterium]